VAGLEGRVAGAAVGEQQDGVVGALVGIDGNAVERLSTAALRAFCRARRSTLASVSRNASMVAMQGWIMPEPLAMPVKRQVLPLAWNVAV
jgi:hypothetical protein